MEVTIVLVFVLFLLVGFLIFKKRAERNGSTEKPDRKAKGKKPRIQKTKAEKAKAEKTETERPKKERAAKKKDRELARMTTAGGRRGSVL